MFSIFHHFKYFHCLLSCMTSAYKKSAVVFNPYSSIGKALLLLLSLLLFCCCYSIPFLKILYLSLIFYGFDIIYLSIVLFVFYNYAALCSLSFLTLWFGGIIIIIIIIITIITIIILILCHYFFKYFFQLHSLSLFFLILRLDACYTFWNFYTILIYPELLCFFFFFFFTFHFFFHLCISLWEVFTDILTSLPILSSAVCILLMGFTNTFLIFLTLFLISSIFSSISISLFTLVTYFCLLSNFQLKHLTFFF